MTRETILIIDDEQQIQRAMRNLLEEVGRVVCATTGREGIDLAAAASPQLIILDLGLPDLPGVEVCGEIRRWSRAPIVVLSARHSEPEKVLLLERGADDYITKPFSPTELKARIRAQLRRARMAEPATGAGPLVHGALEIDFAKRQVTRDGEPVHLTPTEWELLRTFAAHPGQLFTHEQLFRRVWGHGFGDPKQHLRVHVANLRRKIEANPVRPQVILTEPGVGYRFSLPPS